MATYLRQNSGSILKRILAGSSTNVRSCIRVNVSVILSAKTRYIPLQFGSTNMTFTAFLYTCSGRINKLANIQAEFTIISLCYR